MALKIRLARRGRKFLAMYDVVAMDGRQQRDGRHVEKLGTYNPHLENGKVVLNRSRFFDYVNNGAVVSDGVSKALIGNEKEAYKELVQIYTARQEKKRQDRKKRRLRAAERSKATPASDAKKEAAVEKKAAPKKAAAKKAPAKKAAAKKAAPKKDAE